MVYLIVLIGSLLGMCAIAALHAVLKHHRMRRFVNGFSAKHITRRATVPEETSIERRKRSQISARELGEVQILLRKGEKLLARGELEEAEKVFIQALTLDPHAHSVQRELSKLYLLGDRPAKAEALLRELLGMNAEAGLYGNLGLACYKQGKFSEAYDAYRKALEKDPKNAQRMVALAKACIASERLLEAIPLLEKAALKHTRDIELLRLLADCFTRTGNAAKTGEVYERIQKIDPYNTKVQEKPIVLAAQ